MRGQRVVFDATMGQPADKRTPHRWPLKASLKSGLLQASLDGHANVAEDLQVTGPAEVSTPSLRRLARWFGLPLYVTEGFNATVIKGDLTWANRSLVFEKAKVSVDGNEANGRIALHLGGDRPLAGVAEALAARDRRAAGYTAPAGGLYFAAVRYPPGLGVPPQVG